MTIGAMERSIGASKGVLSRAISNGTDIQSKWIQIIVENYPRYSPEWLLTGKGKMLKSNAQEDEEAAPKISYNPQVGQPYYDVDFLAGFDEVFNSQVSIPACNVVVPGFTRVSLWCNVTGHSMEPQINHGDMIALRECTVRDIQYGEVYAVVLDTIRTIKIIRKGSSPKVLRYIPVNEKYDEQEFEIERIIKVYEVVGNISKFI